MFRRLFTKRITASENRPGSTAVAMVRMRLDALERLAVSQGDTVAFNRHFTDNEILRLALLAGDFETTCHLVRVEHQLKFLNHWFESVDVAEFVNEESSSPRGSGEPHASISEAKDMYKQAKSFCGHIADLVEAGEIRRSSEVEAYLENSFKEILSGWKLFESRVRQKIHGN